MRRRAAAAVRAEEEGVRTMSGIGVGSLMVSRRARRESCGARKVER
jgi:hypothetical protein